ncbi:MAG: TonB-dependent receptor [Paraglaciecola sp.]|uniref:TonB-dependent receptor n=1 Tax=Paraglaciecola sp. TaxID=1920173 RepID=UPI003299EDB2
MKYKISKTYQSVVLALTVSSCFSLNYVFAAEEDTVKEKSTTFEVIEVKSRKRVENVRDIPIAISSMGEEKLDALGADTLGDIIGNVPNLAIDPNGNSLSSWGMRGIVSVTRNAGQESGLGVYVDGVYAGRPASYNVPTSDIQQVEVLRGPQGSLFGRNTIAGAINITTKAPEGEFAGNLSASFGNFSRVEIQGGISGELIEDVLSAKVSVFSSKRDGYVKNVFDNNDYMDNDRQGGRIGLYWTPSSNLSFTLASDFVDQDNNQLFGQTVEPQLNEFVPDWYQNDPYTVNHNDPNSEEIQSGGTSLTAEWEMDSGFILTSITAKRYADFEVFADDDAGPITLSYSHFEDNSETFSQELRLTSPENNSFDYLVGVYYLDQEITANRETITFDPFPTNSLGIFSDASVDSEAWAIFATTNFRLNEELTLSVGLRYTDEEKSSVFQQLENADLGFPTVSFEPTIQDSGLSGDISVGYELNREINLYSSIRKGIKSGGFQTDIIDFSSEDLFAFEPEEATSYEIGMKGILLDNTLRLDLALFHTDYENMQVGQLLGLGFTTTNAGEAEITGVEVEFEWLATDDLAIGFNGGVMDNEYTSYDGCNGATVSCAGNNLQYVTDWTAATTIDYFYNFDDDSGLNIHLDATARSDSFSDAINDPDLIVEGYTLLNARISYVTPDEDITVALWVKNITDKTYSSLRWKYPITPIAFGEFDPSITGAQHLLGSPRTFGLDVSYRF